MHLIVVEAYSGLLEFTGAERADAAVEALGLPLEDIAARLDARITVLNWDDWLAYEATKGSFVEWMPFPATRSLRAPGPSPAASAASGSRVRRLPVPAVDPDTGRPLSHGLSARVHGLLANSDPLFLVSYCLDRFLQQLYVRDPFEVVVVPMWGGIGYVAQLGHATGASALRNVAFGTVVTGVSLSRHEVNGEGLWTRPAVTRRQMEDMSLALAGGALCFGPLGAGLARRGRLPDARAPVLACRALAPAQLESVAAAAEACCEGPTRFAYTDPLEAALGSLLTLDAAAWLSRSAERLDGPIHCCGPDMVFAPMRPRSFREYWSSRGFVREIEASGAWTWQSPGQSSGVTRLAPASFAHLPVFWSDLAKGFGLLLSPLAAEGLAPGAELPAVCLLERLTPDHLAQRLLTISRADPGRREETRRRLCSTVVRAHSADHRARLLESACGELDALAACAGRTSTLGRAAMLLLDRTRPLYELARDEVCTAPPRLAPDVRPGSLSAVVVCFEMGTLLLETVHSIWSSTRVPDEVLIVDDGSTGVPTRQAIAQLQSESKEGRGPLTLLRQGNRGLAAARNAGLAAVQTEFVSFIDGDDLIEPRYYELAVDLLQREPRLGGVAAWAETFGVNVPRGFWNAPQAEFPLLLVENTVFVPCTARTALLRELGGYDGGQRFNYEDWELSIRMLASGWPIVTLPLYLQQYRVRSDSLLRTMTEVQNQTMRERLLGRHRSVVERFAAETAMLIEYELMRRVHWPAPAAESGSASRSDVAGGLGGSKPWRLARAALRRLRRAGGGSA